MMEDLSAVVLAPVDAGDAQVPDQRVLDVGGVGQRGRGDACRVCPIVRPYRRDIRRPPFPALLDRRDAPLVAIRPMHRAHVVNPRPQRQEHRIPVRTDVSGGWQPRPSIVPAPSSASALSRRDATAIRRWHVAQAADSPPGAQRVVSQGRTCRSCERRSPRRPGTWTADRGTPGRRRPAASAGRDRPRRGGRGRGNHAAGGIRAQPPYSNWRVTQPPPATTSRLKRSSRPSSSASSGGARPRRAMIGRRLRATAAM